MRAARKGGGVQRDGQLAKEKRSAIQNMSAAVFISLPSSLQPSEPISLSQQDAAPGKMGALPTVSFPRLRCSEVTPLPGKGLHDPTIWEAKQGKSFLAREKKDLGGPLGSGDPPDPHRKQL